MGAQLNDAILDHISNDYMSTEAKALVEKAHALGPLLAANAHQADEDGKVCPEVIAAIDEAGLFRILQPKRWGGYEMDPRVFYRCQMALAQHCMSTAWMYGVIGVHFWQLSLFPEQAQQDVWAQNPATLIASTYMPVGKAEKVDGGYRLSGHWKFSTGVEHCQWLFLGGLLPNSDGSDGMQHTTFLVPVSEVTVKKNWDVLGLRGTGSHDIIVDDVFVPSHHTNSTNDHSDAACPGREHNSGWLYNIPFIQVFQRAVSSACIGALDGTINNFREYAASHVGAHGGQTAQDPNAQLAVSEAMMLSDQLKLVLYRNYEQVVQNALAGQEMPVEERLFQRAQSAYVAKSCAEKVNDIMRATAASGTYKSNPIERFFRDLNQARGHIANNADAYLRAHGAVMLGLPNQDPFV
ncbi:acyl-CoA dehydrogenase family protein [Thalassotalea ponticola]|uniref:acyl-CoA dehydrogenase family protein n=1 Tax=Thalassotalea ponticola TaxID=1523392 RepID=UPI0025B28BB1|nr:acyl-CoA dehydrogenase family protein [Thalassotalea ponticola]MDN3653801.1 acyl-CoA dehydrogenase family protein [Thalassotalea ponticola]